MLSVSMAFSQTLQKSMNFQVDINDLEILKLIVNDYNKRLIQTNYSYTYTTNEIATIVTNTVTMLVPDGGITNENGSIIIPQFKEQSTFVVSTNIAQQINTITNISVITNGIWYNTAEDFYNDKILSLVDKYHAELIKTTVRDYLRNQYQQCTNENDKSVIYDRLKNYE